MTDRDRYKSFAIMTREEFEKNGNVLKLRPWGRVEITTNPQRELEIEMEPLPNQELPGIFPLVPGKNTRKANFNGLAVMSDVMPGAKYRVYGYANLSDGTSSIGNRTLVARSSEPVSVASGETLKIELPLVGQPVRMKPQFAGVENLLQASQGLSVTEMMQREQMQLFAGLTAELQRTDGKLTLPGRFNRVTGTLMFYTVEEGLYHLTLRVSQREVNNGQPSEELSVTEYAGKERITVLPIPGGWSVETLDLGDVPVVKVE